ncbi:hypothetical protein BOSP111201_03165 [Bordetella sputigena]|uniref:hypothetical protein n=1 Tax=Bordetella sputigena TaxID=1416810 RepID=UPI0039EE6BBF
MNGDVVPNPQFRIRSLNVPGLLGVYASVYGTSSALGKGTYQISDTGSNIAGNLFHASLCAGCTFSQIVRIDVRSTEADATAMDQLTVPAQGKESPAPDRAMPRAVRAADAGNWINDIYVSSITVSPPIAADNALITFDDGKGNTIDTRYLLAGHDVQSSDLLMILLYARCGRLKVSINPTGYIDPNGHGYIAGLYYDANSQASA